MKILGYSERGIINSLIFSIGEDEELMDGFISKINIPEIESLKDKVKDYTILLEQSFSRFGDSDLVIVIEYEEPQKNKVIFIEGKVNTFNGRWNIQSQFDKYLRPLNGANFIKTSDYWSNLFSQLDLKKLLIENWSKIVTDKEFEINTAYLGNRKIGSNGIVLNALQFVECNISDAYFVGLIPSTEVEIKEFKKRDNTGNYYISWEKVHEFCKEYKLEKVLDIFEYNKGQIYKYDELI